MRIFNWWREQQLALWLHMTAPVEPGSVIREANRFRRRNRFIDSLLTNRERRGYLTDRETTVLRRVVRREIAIEAGA